MGSGGSRRRTESLLDLAFQAIQELTTRDAERWALLELLKKHPQRLLELFKTLNGEHGYSYDVVSAAMNSLVRKGLAVRPRQGKYEPNYGPILLKMMKLVESMV